MKLKKLGLIKLRKKKRISNIVWTNVRDNIIQYADSCQSGDINLTSGKFTKSSFPSSLENKIISLSIVLPGDSGATVVSVLSSCEVAFYNINSKCLKTVKCPQELLVHISQYSYSRSLNPLQRLQSLAKQHGFSSANRDENNIYNETTIKENTSECMFKPKIFSSQDLSNIILLTEYSKIYLLTKEPATYTWNTFAASSDIQMPSKNSKEACIDVSFITNGPTGLSCYIGCCFAFDNRLLMTSLTLQWYPDRLKSAPSAEWLSKTIDFDKIETSILVRKRKSIVMKYSSEEPILCIAVNTLKNHYYLIFYDVDCQSAAVIDCFYPRRDQRLNNRYQWVSCLEWSTGSNFVIGCLRSGYIFIATRFGPLLMLNWNNSEALPSVYINIFPDFNYTNGYHVDNDKSEQSSQSSAIFTPKFTIITNSSRKSIVVSSGLDFCWLALPDDVCSNEGVVSFLLKRTHEANHKLETSLLNHEYDFIHCSNWRLAGKHHHKASTEENENEEERMCSLWFPGNAPFSNSSTHSRVQTEIEIKETEVFGLLQVTWSLLVSRNLKKRERKLLSKASVSETLKLFTSIMKTSSGNDNEEHQESLLRCLRFFHCLTEYSAAVTVHNFKVIKLSLQVLYDMLHLIMESVDEASSERKLICVIILTQSLILCKTSLMKRNNSSFLETTDEKNSKFGTIIDILMRRHWMYLYSNLFVWKKRKLRNVPQLSCMLTVALNIIQEHCLPVIAAYRKAKITTEYRLYGSGKYFAAIENSRNEIEQLLENDFCRKRLKKCLVFPFYVLLTESRWNEFVQYIYWLYKKISTPFSGKRKICSKKIIKCMKNVFIKLCGALGIIMSKFILGLPVHILNSLDHYDYSSVFDNPTNKYKILNSEKHFEKNLFTPLNATRCLIIGRKYEALFHFSSKRKDLNLCIFSLFALKQTARTDFQILEDFLVDEISSCLKNNAENCSVDETSQAKLYIWTEKLFHLGALEGLQNFLPRCLQMCLQEMDNLIKDLPLIVPFNFHLPAPPLFCPQMDNYNDVDVAVLEDDIEREFRSRNKLAHWITQFCLLCCASGLDSIFVKFTIEEGLESNYRRKDLINIYSSLEHVGENLCMEEDDQWRKLKCIWLSFIEIICTLHTRDVISIKIRSLAEAKMNLQKYKIIQEINFQIMEMLNMLLVCNTTWKYEAFSLLVACVLDSSNTEETVHLVSRAVAYQDHIPSLLKGKFSKILEAWKDIKICRSYDNDPNKKENFFNLYQERLKLEQEKIKTTCQDDSLFPLCKEYIDMICLLFSTAFLKRQFEHLNLAKSIPYLQQFSNRIRNMELEGLKPVEILSAFINIQNSKLKDLKSVENAFPSNVLETIGKQRKGLFRANKTGYCLQSSEDTAAIFYHKNISEEIPKRRTKSFSQKKRKTYLRNELTRSKSLIYMKQEEDTQKTVLSLKSKSSDISWYNLFNKLISEIYFSFQHLDSDLSSISPLFQNFVLWILRSDRIKNVFHDKISNCLDIASFSDMKQAIIWHCSSIQTRSQKAVSKITQEKSSSKRKRVKNLTKYNAKHSQQNVISCPSNLQQKVTLNTCSNDIKLLDKIDIEKNIRNNVQLGSSIINKKAEAVLNSSQISNESHHINNLPAKSTCDSIKKHDDIGSDNRNDVDISHWQPFIVQQKPLLHTNEPAYSSLTYAIKNKDYRADSNMFFPSNEYPQNSKNKDADLKNNLSITSDDKYSSSQSYGATSDMLDNTLDDISLSKVLSGSLTENSVPYYKISSEHTLEKQTIPNLETPFERNNIDPKSTLMKEKQSPSNADIKLLNCQKLRPEIVQNEPLSFLPHNLSLHPFADHPKVPTHNDAEWTLKQIPVQLLNIKTYTRPEMKVPSTLLRIPVDSLPQPPESFKKEILLRTEIFKNAFVTNGCNSFRLLKIPDESKSAVDRNKRRDMLNVSNVKHTLHNSLLNKVTKSPISDKFTQTHCENSQVKYHKNIAFSKTESDEAASRFKSDLSLNKVKQDMKEKVSPNLKSKIKSSKCKNVQTNLSKFDAEVKDNSTQTNNFEKLLTPKISKAINVNLQVPADITKEVVLQHKGVQVKIIEETNVLADNHTQTTAPSIDQIFADVRKNDSTISKIKETSEIKSQANLRGVHLELLEKFTQTRPENGSSRISIETQTQNTKTWRSDHKETPTAAHTTISVSPTEKCITSENSNDSENSCNKIQSLHQTSNKFDIDIENEDSGREDDIYNQEFLSGLYEKDNDKNDRNSIPVNNPSINKNIYEENDNISENVYEADSSHEREDEILKGSNISSTLLQERPETVQDLLNLFMGGRIQVDEVCDLASRFPEILKMTDNSNSGKESPPKTLNHVLEDINKVKKEISQTKCMLEKVHLFASKCVQDDMKIGKYIDKFLERDRSTTKVKLPSKPSQTEVIEFLEQISPEALTQNNISQIMTLLDLETNKNRNIPSESKLTSPVSYSPTLTQNDMLNSEVVDHSHSRGRSGANFYILDEPASHYTENIQSELNLHLSKFGLGSYSSTAAPFTPDSITAKEQKRKKEIHAYMQRKRRERKENNYKSTNCDNKGSLTGREIMERNNIMKTKRAKLKEEHFKKRKEEFEIMMEDHICEKESIEPILKAKTNLISPSRSIISNKNSEMIDSISCYEKNSDSEISVSTKPKSQKPKPKMNPLLKREFKSLCDYFTTPRTSHHRLQDFKRETPPSMNVHRRNTAKSNMPETFSRSLERISEIDSSNLSSSDSSWSLPDDIKRILNH